MRKRVDFHGVRLAAGAAGGWKSGRVEEWKMSRFGSKTQRFLNVFYTTRKYRVFILLSFARMISGGRGHSRKTFGISPYIFGHQDETVWVEAVLLHYRNFPPTMRMLSSVGQMGEVDGIFPSKLPTQGKGFWLECLERLRVKLEKKCDGICGGFVPLRFFRVIFDSFFQVLFCWDESSGSGDDVGV